jgi:hypothetical protein
MGKSVRRRIKSPRAGRMSSKRAAKESLEAVKSGARKLSRARANQCGACGRKGPLGAAKGFSRSDKCGDAAVLRCRRAVPCERRRVPSAGRQCCLQGGECCLHGGECRLLGAQSSLGIRQRDRPRRQFLLSATTRTVIGRKWPLHDGQWSEPPRRFGCARGTYERCAPTSDHCIRRCRCPGRPCEPSAR